MLSLRREWMKHWPQNLIGAYDDRLLTSVGSVSDLRLNFRVKLNEMWEEMRLLGNSRTWRTQWIQSQSPLRRCSRMSRMQDRSCSDWVTVEKNIPLNEFHTLVEDSSTFPTSQLNRRVVHSKKSSYIPLKKFEKSEKIRKSQKIPKIRKNPKNPKKSKKSEKIEKIRKNPKNLKNPKKSKNSEESEKIQ